MTFQMITLGCKANQADTVAIASLLRARGYETAEKEAAADIYIINTCAVTAESTRKSRAIIRRVKKEHPNAFVAICGCFSELNPEKLTDLGADLIAGSKQREQFVRALEGIISGNGVPVVDEITETFEILPVGGLDGRTRALLKIQDGCENFCTFCIVPYARGKVRSMPREKVLNAVQDLAQQGYKELVITGIEISSWGKEFDGDLVQLLAKICNIVPEMRVRLGSLEPRTITTDFCETLKHYRNLCPHFHLSLQSGSDAILQKMGRKYDTKRYMESVVLLREHFPNCAITTDIIVGFPGESEADFEQTLSFVKNCAFADVHVFPYSKREGTPAAEMSSQLLKTEKARRSKLLRTAAESLQNTFLYAQIGQRVQVLFETEHDGVASGYSMNYCPVEIWGQGLENQVKLVEIQAVKDGKLEGILV